MSSSGSETHLSVTSIGPALASLLFMLCFVASTALYHVIHRGCRQARFSIVMTDYETIDRSLVTTKLLSFIPRLKLTSLELSHQGSLSQADSQIVAQQWSEYPSPPSPLCLHSLHLRSPFSRPNLPPVTWPNFWQMARERR